MAITLSCTDLGIEGCDFQAHGETNDEALKAMVEHLRSHHSLDIREDDVLVGDRSLNEEVGVVVRRLREKLETPPLTDEPKPLGGSLLRDI